MSADLGKYGIVAKAADGRDIEGALVACETGCAAPITVTLLCHIAWMQERIGEINRAVVEERRDLNGALDVANAHIDALERELADGLS